MQPSAPLNGVVSSSPPNNEPIHCPVLPLTQVQLPEMHVSQPKLGVLGAMIQAQTNRFIAIFPGSDLCRYNIRPGDIVVAANGRDVNPAQYLKACEGPIGSTITLTICASGRGWINATVVRKDPMLFQRYIQMSPVPITNANHYLEVNQLNR